MARITVTNKLITRLKAEGYINADTNPVVHRIRGSRDQRENGTWSWILLGTGCPQIGSFETVKECVEAPHWKLGPHNELRIRNT